MVNGALYLVLGKEDFLKKEFLKDLRRRFFPNGDDFNHQEFNLEKAPLSSVIDFLQTAPFLGEKRLAFAFGLDELEEDEKKALLAFAKKMPPTAALALISEEASAKKNSFLEKLSELAEVAACQPPYERELPGWIEARAKKGGKSIDRAAIPILMERGGKDIASLGSAVEQLLVYTGTREKIQLKDVETLLGKSLQGDSFLLVDALLAGDLKRCFEIASMLFTEGTRAFELVAVIASQMERLRKAGAMVAEGREPRDIGLEVRVPPYFLDKFMRQVQAFSGGRASRALKALLDCDEAIKTGKMSDRIAFEKLLLEICLVGKQA